MMKQLEDKTFGKVSQLNRILKVFIRSKNSNSQFY